MASPEDGKLLRTFSSSNLHAANRIHEYISDQERSQGASQDLAKDVTKSTMIIPTFKKMKEVSARLPSFILSSITDVEALNNLEKEGSLNWCSSSRTFFPLKTDPDGNCLFHAISMFIWGIHDRKLNVRRFVQRKLVAENRFHGKLYLRWTYDQQQALHTIASNMDSTEVRRDWDEIVLASSAMPCPYGNRGLQYSSLEDIHIFTASVVLARPIIVLCDKVQRSFDGRSLQPNRMGGIYLPLLRDPSECEKSPIVIAYWQCHFLPLLNCEDIEMQLTKRTVHPDAQLCVPLVYKDLSQMQVRFMLPDEQRDELLFSYLDCTNIPMRDMNQVETGIPAAVLKFKPPPAWSVELMWSLFYKTRDIFFQKFPESQSYVDENGVDFQDRPSEGIEDRNVSQWGSRNRLPSSTLRSSVPTVTSTVSLMQNLGVSTHGPEAFEPCQRSTIGCKNQGNPSYNNLCEQCYENFLKETSCTPINLGNSTESSTNRALKSFPQSLQSVKECKSAHCTSRGFKELHDLCAHCYTIKIRDQSSSVTVSHATPESKYTITSSTMQIQNPGSLSESLTNPNSISSQFSALSDRPQAPSKVETGPSVSAKAKKFGKILCAEPGCQEPPIPQHDLCRYHKLNMADCISEGCKNKADDIEVPLCSLCKQKQVDVQSSRQKDHRSTKPVFNSPEIYPTFSKAKYDHLPPTPSQAPYDSPEWQGIYRGNKVRVCKEILCDHFAVDGKDGFCNECYEKNRQIVDQFRQKRKCLSVNCDRDGEATFNGLCPYCFHPSIPPNSPTEPDPSQHIYEEPIFLRQSTSSSSIGAQPPNTSAVIGQYSNDLSTRVNTGSASVPQAPFARKDPTPAESYNNILYSQGQLSLRDRSRRPMKCSTAGCMGQAKETNNGFCDDCLNYERLLDHQEPGETRDKNPSAVGIHGDRRCKNANCPNPGSQTYDGHCAACYRKILPPRHSAAGFNSIQSEARYQPVSVSGRGSQCSTSGCSFYASPEYGPYCSKCFLEKTKAEVGAVSNQGTTRNTAVSQANSLSFGRGPSSVVRLPAQTEYRQPLFSGQPLFNGQPCRKPGCMMFGTQEQDGYCSRCYR